jgi:hypothetical protein
MVVANARESPPGVIHAPSESVVTEKGVKAKQLGAE